jgi:sialic acid synthase SpsE
MLNRSRPFQKSVQAGREVWIMKTAIEIITELHPQHHGDLGVLFEMIRQVREGGADVAKIQLYDAGELLGPAWQYLEFDRDQLRCIKEYCDDVGIELMASVFDRTRLDWCEDLGLERYKIASRTVVDDPKLCEEILDLGKVTFVSLGQWTGSDLPFGDRPTARHLFCVSKYPALAADLKGFPSDFPAESLDGYSDHSLGIDWPLLAVARGAAVIEKHFTLSKEANCATERGHAGSMDLADLVLLRRFGDGLLRAHTASA